MKRTALATLLFVLPAATFALDFQHGDDGYSDASRFTAAERAAVSVLTDVGAVSGNPDGSFAPGRTLNRAEFTKIALLSMDIDVSSSDAATCFPDVPRSAWFSMYVCRAKGDGIVEGNPDGLFHPERAVNYAEAAKILVELAGYDLPEPPSNERWAWYRAYLLAAEEHGVELPGSVDAGTELTRGQMARLAAAFVAEAEGELGAYRDAERGEFEDESSSSSSSSSSSAQTSSSSSSSVSSSSSSRAVSILPVRSGFLLSGQRSAILGGTVTSTDEASFLRIVRLTLRREVVSIDKVYLVDGTGSVIAELRPSTNNNDDDRKWEVFLPESTYLFPANKPVEVGVMLLLKPKDGGGGSNLLVEIESFLIQAEGQTTGSTKYLFTDSQVYPVHQTAFARLTRATGTLPSAGTVQQGAQKQIASVRVEGVTATGGIVTLEGLELVLTATDVSVSNVRIGDASKNSFADCGIEKLETIRVTCDALPESLEVIPAGGMTVSVYADLALTGPNNGSLSVAFAGRGSVAQAGSVAWGDGVSRFTWLQDDAPFGGNTTWTVTK